MGVLGAYTTTRREFADHEVTFLQNVATLLASAIETHRTEARLEEAQTRNERIVEASPAGITVVDEDGEMQFVNERAEEILGRDRAEITSFTYDDSRWELVDTDGEPLSAEQLPFEQVMNSGEIVRNVDVEVRRPDGRRVWLSINGAPLRTDGELTGAVFELEDITERKRLVDELATTLDRITDAFYALDDDWNFTYVNDRATELIDFEAEGLIGKNIWETFERASETELEPKYRRAMETEEATSFELYYPEPLETWFEVHAYPSESGLSVYFQDISDRKRVEARLRHNHETLQRLYAISSDRDRSFDTKVDRLLELGRERLDVEAGFLATVDEDADHFEVTHATGGDERLEPGSVEPLSDTYCRRTIDSEEPLALENVPDQGWSDDHAYDKWDYDCYVGGKVLVDDELYGTLCFVDTDARTAEFTEAERAFVELVTQWVSYELERKRHERALEESNERLEQFAYAVSHDLQEPLRMVTSYLQLLEDRCGEKLDDDGREFVEFAVDGAERMRTMIDGLLEYSRVETQGAPLEPVDLDGILEDVLDDLQLKIDESNADIDSESLPSVRADRDQLRQVFQNLLSNAIRYSGDGPPRISVEAERDGPNWIVSVHDEGIGIDFEETDRIFEVFQRLHTVDEHPGTGIGLALVRRIVERHDGRIWVDSEPGEGSTFSFTLPAVES